MQYTLFCTKTAHRIKLCLKNKVFLYFAIFILCTVALTNIKLFYFKYRQIENFEIKMSQTHSTSYFNLTQMLLR